MGREQKYYLRSNEFAFYEGISLRTLRRRIREGMVCCVKDGKNLLFHYTELRCEKVREKFLMDRGLVLNGAEEKKNGQFHDLPPWQREIADKRMAVVKDYLAADREIPWGRRGIFKGNFGGSNGVNSRTLDRWIEAYQVHGYYGLIPNWNGGRQIRILDKEMIKFIENTYLVPFGPSVKETHEKLLVEFHGKRDRLPSYPLVVNFIAKRWTKSQQTLIRNKEAWDRKFSPYVRRDWNAVKLNEVWFGDAKQVDVACLFRGKAVFPWFTAFLDARSRKFVGWILSPIHDSWAIAQAYAYGISLHGPPQTVYVDHGKPYKSFLIAGQKIKRGRDLKVFDGINRTIFPGIVRETGGEMFFATQYSAREKIIEPAFKVFTFRQTGLPGYRGHSVRTRPKKLAREIRKDLLLSFEELSGKVDELINSRNERAHSTTGRSPNSFYEGYVPVAFSKELLAYLLMDAYHDVKVQDSAIVIKKLVYRSDDLWRLSGEKVEARRDPQDIRRAAVIYEGKLFCFADLEMADHYRGPITLESVKTCARIRKNIRKWRKAVIENEAYIENPMKMAIELSEDDEVRARDIRPASSKVRGLGRHERLAREIVGGLEKVEMVEEHEKKAVAGGSKDDYSPLFPIKKYVRAEEPDRLPLFSSSFNDPAENEDE